jgi:hypothetical protein
MGLVILLSEYLSDLSGVPTIEKDRDRIIIAAASRWQHCYCAHCCIALGEAAAAKQSTPPLSRINKLFNKITMATEEEKEPEAKGLRSCEPDLVVTVGNGDNAKEYRYHLPIMASHSTYIDTMLASPMKESQSSTINFPDLTPDLWETMVKYLDPLYARSLSIEMAMELAPAYDKYSFDRGLKLCDQVLSEVFEKNGRMHGNEKPLHDLELLIDAFLIANEANLKDAMKQGVPFFRKTLCSKERYGKIMFSERQIEKLVPLLVKEQLLEEQLLGFRFGAIRHWTVEQIENPCE